MVEVKIYFDDGNIIAYKVRTEQAAREHAYYITQEGYRGVEGTGKERCLVWYPARRIKKVKLIPFRGGYYNDARIVS